MPGVASYFSTAEKTFTWGQQQTGGFWGIRHAGITGTSGKNKGVELLDPFHIKNRNQMRNYGINGRSMKDYSELREVMKLMFLSTARDPGLIQRIKDKLYNRFPIRSGKLMDIIYKTMHILRSAWYSTHYFIELFYEYPSDRPKFINHAQHSPPAKGYGEWASYRPVTPEAISRISIDHVTGRGNALYNLNDPQAVGDIQAEIENEASLILEDDFAETFNDIIITYTMKGL